MQFFESSPIVIRFQQILESEYAGILLPALVFAVCVMILLVVSRAYRPLLLMLLVGQMFSQSGGSTQGLLTLMRFASLFALAILGVRGLGKMRASQTLMIVFACYTFLLMPLSEYPAWSFQRSLAFSFLAAGLFGATISYATTLDRVQKTLMVVTLAALAWVAVNGVFGSTGGVERGSGEARYAGVVGATGQMANVGGFLPPFLLWGFFRSSRRSYKYLCLAGFLVILPMLVYVGQRIGLFAAFIGLVPLLWFRFGGKRLVLGICLLLGVGLVTFQLLLIINPTTRSYLLDKYVYRVSDLSGREALWQATLQECLRSPIVGHGNGVASIRSTISAGMGVHNSYLELWFDGGILALMLWAGVIVFTVFRCIGIVLGPAPPDAKEDARLMLGCILALSAQAFFESTLTSPTNLNAGLFLLCITLIDRVRLLSVRAPQPIPRQMAFAGSTGIR